MRKLIDAIELKHRESGIDVYAPASDVEINAFERRIGFQLALDFKAFYSVCNGLAAVKIFSICYHFHQSHNFQMTLAPIGFTFLSI